MLHGVYCEAGDAVRAALQPVAACEFMSGGQDIPRFIIETGVAGLPQSVSLSLQRLAVRTTSSAWKLEDAG